MLKIKKILIKYKTILIFSLIGLIILAPISLLIYNSLSNKRDFILANYQSYINPQVQTKLENKYGVSFDYFESAESAKTLLKKNTADIVNTTSYELVNWAKQGLIKKLDWSIFGQKIGRNDIKNADDALNLFIQPVQGILQSYDINGDGQKDNLLEYGIPYFLQDLVFCYRGSKINKLHENIISWDEVLNIISNESRFKNINNSPKLISLNDSRTMYSIPRIIQNNTNINPERNSSINNLQTTFKIFANKINQIGKNCITFNSDSGAILNKLATNEVNGAFCFNGDALYAAYGGDEGVSIDIDNDIHIVKPENNLVALDLFVINEKINDKNLNKAYDLLSSLCLNTKEKQDSIPYINFDYVYYTSPLESIKDIINTQLSPRELKYLEISSTNISNRVEQPLDDITKSNFQFAWTGFKSYL